MAKLAALMQETVAQLGTKYSRESWDREFKIGEKYITDRDLIADDWTIIEPIQDKDEEDEGFPIYIFAEVKKYKIVKLVPCSFYKPSSLLFSRTFGQWTESDITRLLAAWQLGVKLIGYYKVEA